MKLVQRSLLSIALAFLNVPTIPANAADFIPPGMTLEELIRMIERYNRDFDGDGVNDHHDDCPSVSGTSTIGLSGCPDDDGDGYANKIDICPNETNHQTCLSSRGLYTYPVWDAIGTCNDLAYWHDQLRAAKWILWGTSAVTGLVGAALKDTVTVAGAVGLVNLGGSLSVGGALLSGSAQSNANDVYRDLCK